LADYTLRQLSYFVATAEGGSVAEAARRLNVAQPSVSSAIHKLEDLFGVQLFLRHHAQGVSLTSAGRRLVAEARSLLAYAEELSDRAQGLGRTLRGRLDVGCFLSFAPLYLPGLLTRFAADYPDVEIQLHEAPQDGLVDDLETGRIDLALLYDIGLGPALTQEPLIELPPYALLPDAHPMARHRQAGVSLRELAAQPLILLDVPPSRDYFTGLFRPLAVEPRIGFRTPSFETVRGMVANGLGYSLLVTRPAGDLSYDGRPLACRPILEPSEPGRIVVARLAQARPTRLIEAFLAFCRSYFSELGR